MPETPIVFCPNPQCKHPIDQHVAPQGCRVVVPGRPPGPKCSCAVTPNTIAAAAVHTALYGDLTQPPRAQHVVRQPDGSWS